MAGRYYLNERDRAIVADVVSRVGGGTGNNRPLARRRRQVRDVAAAGVRIVPALIFADVPAATINKTELYVQPGVTETVAAWLLEHAELEDGSLKLTIREEDDPQAQPPASGQEPAQIRVARKVLNYAAAKVTASQSSPKLVHGFVQNFKVGSADQTYFVLTDWVRNSVMHGTTTSAVNGTQFNATTLTVISGTEPRTNIGTEAVTIKNPFSFEINSGGDFRAEQDDNGDWQLTQAECPV